MIKIFFVLFISFGCTLIAIAQDFHAGIRVGFCASQVSGDNLSGFDKAGLLAGAFVSRDLSDKISLQMEMVFIQKGSRKPVSEEDNSYYRMRLHYLEVPLLLKFHATEKITIQAGPSAGVLIHSQEANQLGEIFYTPPFKKMEISAHLGIQYVLNEKWALDLRHSNSLTTVRDFEGSYNYFYFEKGQYNSSLQFSIQYTF